MSLMNLNEYSNFLNSLEANGWRVAPLYHFRNFKPEDKVVGIRHDIETNFEVARSIARMEAEHQVYSSYFLFPHADFYSRHAVNYFFQLGHEVGIHYDILGLTIKLGINVHSFLIQLLMELRRMNIPIAGVSPHVSEEVKRIQFKAWEYFFEFSRDENLIEIKNPWGQERHILMGVHPLSEYGLSYEASQLEKKNFIYENKGSMRINKGLADPPDSWDDVRNFINTGGGKTLISLSHNSWSA